MSNSDKYYTIVYEYSYEPRKRRLVKVDKMMLNNYLLIRYGEATPRAFRCFKLLFKRSLMPARPADQPVRTYLTDFIHSEIYLHLCELRRVQELDG